MAIGLSIFFGVIALALLFLSGKIFPDDEERTQRSWMRWGGLGSFSVSCLIFTGACFTTVSTGHVAVATLFGEVTGDHYDEGFHLVAPWISLEEISIEENRYQGTHVQCYTADDQPVHVDFTFAWSLIPSVTPTVKQKLSKTYIPLVEDAGRSALRMAISDFPLSTSQQAGAEGSIERTIQQQRGKISEVFKKRIEDLTDQIFESKGLPKGSIVLSTVNVRDIDPGETIRNAAAAALKQQQMIKEERHKQELSRVRKDRLKIDAEAERDAQMIIAEGATPTVIALRYIEALERMSETLGKSPGEKIVFWPMPPKGIMNVLDIGQDTK